MTGDVTIELAPLLQPQLQSLKPCIFKVPKTLRDVNPQAYTPQLVSFGPYHHGLDHLKPMETHKLRAQNNYLRRANKSLEQLLKLFRPHAQELKDSYDEEELSPRWTENNYNGFLKLMVLDGCFFLDVMIWGTVNFWRPYMTHRLWMDMLRVENQLPLLVLSILIDEGGHKEKDIQDFIKFYDEDNSNEKLHSISGMGVHHLDLHRKKATEKGDYEYDPYYGVRPATELVQAGVRLVQSESSSLKDISFSNGTLKLPLLKFDHNTEPLLLNYLAFEQIFDVGNEVTSYSFLMDNLIDTAQDVALLRKKKIIRAYVGSDDDISTLFNGITKAVTFSNRKGRVNENQKLNDYCRKWWPKLRVSLIHDYCRNLWTIIGLFLALIVLVSTVLSAVYAVLQYYQKK